MENPSGLQVISVTFSDPAFQLEMTATPLVWHDWLSNTGIQNRNKHSIRCMQAERSMAMSSTVSWVKLSKIAASEALA